MSEDQSAKDSAVQAGAADFIDFLWASPSPFHCVAEVARRLEAAGFSRIDEAGEPTAMGPGDLGYLVRDGSIVAWRAGTDAPASAGFRVVAAHTDSPNLRIKPVPDADGEGYAQLGVEVYGGVLLSTWMDRDLGISGRVAVPGTDGPELHLFRCDEPLARVPNLAIHLNRKVNEDGLVLDKQKHLAPVVGMGEWAGFSAWLANRLGVERVLATNLGLHDTQRPAIGGIDDAFVFSGRLDNEACCYVAIQALIAAGPAASTQVVALFDHEEIGSQSYRGARGSLLSDVLARLVRDHSEQAPGGVERAAANSYMISADMAHGVHPNYADMHEPQHKPRINGGPVIKGHASQKYATDAESTARFFQACAALDIPCQNFVTRSDLRCGSTIGPMSAAQMGIRTVDVGMAMLSMHSIREQSGTEDPAMMARVLCHLLEHG